MKPVSESEPEPVHSSVLSHTQRVVSQSRVTLYVPKINPRDSTLSERNDLNTALIIFPQQLDPKGVIPRAA